MKAFLCVCWFAALIILVSLGFRTIIWHLIIPVTIPLAQLPWLEFAINLVTVLCSLLFIALIMLFGGKL